jgi:hypothetical protein
LLCVGNVPAPARNAGHRHGFHNLPVPPVAGCCAVTAIKSSPERRFPTPDAPGLAVSHELRETLRGRSRAVHARGRVAETLYSLALDICGDDGRLQPAERQWLTEALATPVSEAAYEAVDTLLRELAVTLGSAPPRVRPALGSSSPVSRIDFE